MRLICPNCAAQYEVDASMIPDEGRDVQCSSCGHTWYQDPETANDTLADELGVTEADDPFEAQDDLPIAAPPSPPTPAPKIRPMDEAARDILRQEAAREAEARRRDTGGALETQPELGLSDPEGAQTRADAAKARLARLRDAPEEATEEDASQAAIVATSAASSRRELLPDIEEINSTLTATGDRAEGTEIVTEAEEAKSRRGFRFGFFAIFLILLALLLVYLFAPQLAENIPALAPALNGYLNWANGVLDNIDSMLRSAVDSINGVTEADPS